jgi:hypothetical protein
LGVFLNGSAANAEDFARFPRGLAYGGLRKHLSLAICENPPLGWVRGTKATDAVECMKRDEVECSLFVWQQGPPLKTAAALPVGPKIGTESPLANPKSLLRRISSTARGSGPR